MAKAKAKGADTPAGAERRLASVSVSLGDPSPEALLRLGEGQPRGFWAREGRWFAHFGEAAKIQVLDRPASGDRFGVVWAQARNLLSCSWRDPQALVNPPPPRLFGGFSFRDDHLPLGSWESFPPAHFVLPEVELTGGEGGGILTLRRLLPSREDPGRVREEMVGRLDRIGTELRSGAPEPDEAQPWIPATRAETDQSAWTAAVENALGAMSEGGLEKVVMARVHTVSVEGALDPVEILMNLWRANPGSHVFLFEPVPGRILVGAAPETVATVSGGRFRATAVAGSVPRGRNEEEQRALARALLKSRKDRREQRVCVDYMVNRLEDLAGKVQAQDEPHVRTLSTIQHLETVIEAELHPEETVMSTLAALHPTPAVCGVPREAALGFLRDTEPFHRGWYAGPVGWFDGDGNGVFVPALRSAVGGGGEWRLFAGAGIVAGSESAQEWEETRIKFQPVLRAISGARARRDSTRGGE